MDCLVGAAEDQEKGVQLGTHAKYAGSWNCWLVWLEYIGADDPYLQQLSCPQRIRTMCAFMHALRRGDFSPGGAQIKGKTAKTTVDHVAATIVASDGQDPRFDSSNNESLILKRQVQGYKKSDPKTKHQKAIPPEVYRFILRRAQHPRSRAKAELLCGNLFFASRSCEYSKTQKHEEKRTRTLRPCDVQFTKNGRIINHTHPLLHQADYVIVTFGPQKADQHQDEAIPQEATEDPELNPVWHWAHTIRRLMSYPKYDPTWPIYTFYDEKTKLFSDIRSYEILDTIRAAVEAIGVEVLGFTAAEVGTHSNRGAFAMMLYLAGAPVFTIMKLGRWLSDAFLDYIEQQVLAFSRGISTKMLYSNTFFNFPVKPQEKKKKINRDPTSRGQYTGSERSHIFGRSLRDQYRQV